MFEGIQKLIYPDILGAGRFARIDIPAPEIMGPFVGWVELICGVLILVGLFSRLTAWSAPPEWSSRHAIFRADLSWAAKALGIKFPSAECGRFRL